jgi:flagellin-like hook-associated protein FlgL
MPAFTSGIARSLLDLNRANRAADTLGRQLASGKKIERPEDDPGTWAEADRVKSSASFLDAIHTGLNMVATNVRVADTAMQAIENEIGVMQDVLREALTHPPGDPARNALVNTFTTVHGQIDELVNTTHDEGARRILSDPAVYPQAGDLHVVIGPNGAQGTVHARQVHTGPGGLNIPALDPATATDVAINAVLDSLSRAATTLGSRRAGLALDAGQVAFHAEDNARVAGMYRANAEALQNVDLAEAAVTLQSVNTQRSLAIESIGAIVNAREGLLALLG